MQMPVKTTPRVRVALDVRTVVGESIVWSPQEQALYWVDLVGSTIHALQPSTQRHRQWQTPEMPTSIGLRATGGFIVGLRQRVALWEPGGSFETLAVPEPDQPENRLNEGCVAPDGSFWVGTMQDNIAADGSPRPINGALGGLYRIAPDGAVTRLTSTRFGITNTMIWPDDTGFVTADTTANALYRFARRPDGLLGQSTPFGPTMERGLPDGSTQDAAGMIYNCRVGGSAIARLSPEGRGPDYIDLPCTSPTSCVFGGPDLATLYVTSARFGMSAEHLERHPIEGALMAVELDAAGLPPHSFAG